MHGSSLLLVLSALMFIGSFIPGYLPLLLIGSCTPTHIHNVSALGAGLLVGTALSVILPEGVHKVITCPLNEESLSVIGMSLGAGFVFMLVVEQCTGGYGHSHGPSLSQSKSRSIEESSQSQDQDHDEESKQIIHGHSHNPHRNIAPVIGLLVHAAVDGIALSSVASSHLETVELIVFLALMLHKAPAAFGLTVFLLQQRQKRSTIVKYLVLFSLAAPVTCLVTFIGLTMKERDESHGHEETLAACMLFSAGTFLFVATMHILPEIRAQGLHWKEVMIISVGILLPSLLSLEHHH